MTGCAGCISMVGPRWDHAPDCPHWPGSQWSRRHGYMGECSGLYWCEEVHPYEPHDMCGCDGQCQCCSHVGCERCMERAYKDLPWWRKLFKAFTIHDRHCSNDQGDLGR